nr:alpha/beta fold hydrolase [uncultured Caldimonas sp.]
MTIHHVEVPGVTLHVDDIGHGEPVLMLPGMLCDTRLFEFQARELAQHVRVIRIDWRGHGYSTRPSTPWSLDRLAEDVRAVCNVLELDQVTLVGFSLGGMVGMRFALAHPQRVRAMVLMNTSGGREDTWRRIKFHALAGGAGLFGPAPLLTGEAAKAMFSAPFRRRQPRAVSAWRQALGRMDGGVVRRVVEMVADRDSVLPRLQALDIPALVVAGQLDTNTPPAHARALAQHLRRARLVVLRGTGHGAPIEQPVATLAAISDFLKECAVIGEPHPLPLAA